MSVECEIKHRWDSRGIRNLCICVLQMCDKKCYICSHHESWKEKHRKMFVPLPKILMAYAFQDWPTSKKQLEQIQIFLHTHFGSNMFNVETAGREYPVQPTEEQCSEVKTKLEALCRSGEEFYTEFLFVKNELEHYYNHKLLHDTDSEECESMVLWV